MNWKKTGKALLFPRMAVLVALLPVSTALLVLSMMLVGTESWPAYLSYGLATYTLTVWCLRIPRGVALVKNFINTNPHIRRWMEDVRLRVRVSLGGSCLWNAVYGAFQLGLGIRHRSAWFFSLAGYYGCLAVMRFFLLRHTGKYRVGECMDGEWRRYRSCGVMLLLLNLALSVMVFFMVYWNRTFVHREITTIAMATYTFFSLTMAIVNAVKYNRYHSPVYSASKAISLIAACVSVLTLTSTMLNTFDQGSLTGVERKWLLGITGGLVCAFVVGVAVFMIAQSSKRLRVTPCPAGPDET